MPLFTLTTNVEIADDHQAEVLTKLSSFVAQLLGKPESYVMVLLKSGQPMLMGGTNEPCAHVRLKSLGLPEDSTTSLSTALCDAIAGQLRIPANRIYIEFANPARHMWGWDRGTFG